MTKMYLKMDIFLPKWNLETQLIVYGAFFA